MRRLILFALIFGVGLALLVYFEGRGRGRGRPVAPVPADRTAEIDTTTPGPQPAGGGEDGPAEQDSQDPGAGGGSGQHFQVRGGGTYTFFDEKGQKQVLRTTDMQPQGAPVGGVTEYLVTGLEWSVYESRGAADPATVVRANSARLKADMRPSSLAIIDDGHVTLADVMIEQYTGFPYCPIVLTAAELEGWLDRKTFRSVGDHEVRVVGQGVEARGLGFEGDLLAGHLEFRRGGQADLVDGATRAVFTTPGGGPLTVDRAPEGSEEMIVHAEDGALLVVEPLPEGETDPDAAPTPGVPVAEAPIQVDAREMTLYGVVREGREASTLERVVANGAVQATYGTDTYRGEHAVLQLVGQRLTEVVLEDDPRVEQWVVREGQEPLQVLTRGQGPLRVYEDVDVARTRFDLKGPATLTVPERGLSIDASERLNGSVAEARDDATFDAFGDVRLAQGTDFLTCTGATSHLRAVEPLTIVASCKGPVLGQLTDDEGSAYELRATERLELDVSGEHWRVPEALGVTGRSLGEERLSLAAGRVRDFDWAARTFHADRGVEWGDDDGDGRAQQVIAHPGERVELIGTPEQPAQLDWQRLPGAAGEDPTDGPHLATLEAGRIEADALHAEVWDGVRAGVSDDEGSLFVLGGHTRIDLAPEGPEGSNAPRAWELRGEDLREALLTRPEDSLTVRAPDLVAQGWLNTVPREDDPTRTRQELVVEDLLASGGVDGELRGSQSVDVTGQSVHLTGGTRYTFEALDGERVRVRGILPGTGQPFQFDADLVETRDLELDQVDAGALPDQDGPRPQLVAVNVSGWFDGEVVPLGEPDPDASSIGRTYLRARRVVAEPERLALIGDVHLETQDLEGVPLTLEGGSVVVEVRRAEDGSDLPWNEALRSTEANGDVRLAYGGLGRGRADTLVIRPAEVIMRGEPASLSGLGYSLETTYLRLDVERFTIETERGVLRGGVQWALEFASVEPVEREGDLMFVLVHPILTELERVVRADFASFWVYPNRWRSAAHEALWGEPLPLEEAPLEEPPPQRFPQNDLIENIFRRLAEDDLSQYMRAIYLDGTIEASHGGYRVARAERLYLDLEHRRGWMEEAELTYNLTVGGRTTRVRTMADRLVTTGTGALRAADAVLTACSHEEPHYLVQVGELLLEPREDGRWRIGAHDNKIRFKGGWRLPLPSIGNVVLDEGGGFEGFENEAGDVRTVDGIFFGSTARFGTTLGTRGAVDIGDLGRGLADLLGFAEDRVTGKWRYEGAWLSSRGPLVGVGLQLREQVPQPDQQEELWMDLWLRGIPDSGEDKGLIRVDPADRSTARLWTNVRGRYPFSDTEWLDVSFNWQSDPGVQSEYYEGRYLDYEQRDTYLHYRNANDNLYVFGRAQVQSNSWLYQVEQLPGGGAYLGNSQIGELWGEPLQYTGYFDTGYLRRATGDPRYDNPFRDAGAIVDPYGDRQVLRADTAHRLSMPIGLGESGVRLTPFLDAQLSAWDSGIDSGESHGRAGAFGGASLSAAWSRVDAGTVTTLAPTLRARGELAVDEPDGELVRYDAVDDPISGDSIEASLRTIWRRPGGRDRFDLDLGYTQVTGRAQDLPDRDLAFVLGQLDTEFGGIPVAFVQDLRYDLEEWNTPYSTFVVAARPFEDLVLQLAHQRGLDRDEQALYEAASVSGRYTVDAKWELDAGLMQSLIGNGALANIFTLRRFSHDFVLELTFSFRAGEGSGVGINLAPLIGWKRPVMGMLDRPDGTRSFY